MLGEGLEQCISILPDKKGDDCEGYAFRVANSVIKRMQEKEMQTGFLFVDLSLTEGKAFDGLAAGEFTDMLGRKAKFEASELSQYVEKPLTAIESTKTESGEIVGLPIDAKGHDKGDGAGYIVGVELAGECIRIIPQWTEIGLEILQKKIRRWFSATVDLANKVILGGTLTNWPATRDSKGTILLRPIELGLYELQEESLDERTMKIRDAFHAGNYLQEVKIDHWIRDVFENYVIVQEGEKLYRVTYQETQDGITFASRIEWIEVKHAYIEAELPRKEKTMTDLKDTPQINLAELITQDPDVAKQVTELVQTSVKQGIEAELARAKRAQHIVELSNRLIGGSETHSYGLPVAITELQDFLGSLDDAQREKAEKIFTRIQENGLVEFAEKGHSKKLSGQTELPLWARIELEKAINAGMTVAEFFTVNSVELGAQTDYNLAEFEPKKEK
jgi:hypothetical protein